MKIKPAKHRGKLVAEISDSDVRLAFEAGRAHRPSPAFQLKTILAPTDFSQGSETAARYAVGLAEQFGARILLLHVVEPPLHPAEIGYTPIESPHLQRELTESVLKRLEDKAAELGCDIEIKPLVRIGGAYATIDAVAKELEADLIVISTHGYTGLKHIFMGGTAEKVVRHAPCPVLVVRARENETRA